MTQRSLNQALRGILPLAALAALWATSTAHGRDGAAWELLPYRVRVLVAVEAGAQLPRGLQGDLVGDLPAWAAAAVRGYWQVEAAAAAGELHARMLRGLDLLSAAHIPAEHFAGDKLILLAVRRQPAGTRVEARELDVVTRLWNTPVRLDIAQAGLVPQEAFRAVLAAFAPLARIDSADANSARLRIRGAALLPADSGLPPIAAGAVFRPVLLTAGGQPAGGECQPIPWTNLTVRYLTGASAECRLDTALAGAAIPDYHPHRQRWAVAIAPPQRSTRVRLVLQGASSEPLEGYELWSRLPAADSLATPRYELLGRTDRSGVFAVPPVAAAVCVLLVRQGEHRFLEVPLVPGAEDELTLEIDDDPRRPVIEAALNALADRLTDLMVQRQTLAARIAAHQQREEKAAAEALQRQLDDLPAPESLRSELEAQQRAIAAAGPATQKRLEPKFAALRAQLEKK